MTKLFEINPIKLALLDYASILSEDVKTDLRLREGVESFLENHSDIEILLSMKQNEESVKPILDELVSKYDALKNLEVLYADGKNMMKFSASPSDRDTIVAVRPFYRGIAADRKLLLDNIVVISESQHDIEEAYFNHRGYGMLNGILVPPQGYPESSFSFRDLSLKSKKYNHKRFNQYFFGRPRIDCSFVSDDLKMPRNYSGF